MIKLLPIVALSALVGCAGTGPAATLAGLETSASMARLANPEHREKVQAILAGVELTDLERWTCNDAVQNIEAFAENVVQNATLYPWIRDSYGDCFAVVEGKMQTLTPRDQVILRQFHRDAQAFDKMMQATVEGDVSTNDYIAVAKNILSIASTLAVLL